MSTTQGTAINNWTQVAITPVNQFSARSAMGRERTVAKGCKAAINLSETTLRYPWYYKKPLLVCLMTTVAPSASQVQVELDRYRAMRAMLRDNSGSFSMMTKAAIFAALPPRTQLLDVKV